MKKTDKSHIVNPEQIEIQRDLCNYERFKSLRKYASPFNTDNIWKSINCKHAFLGQIFSSSGRKWGAGCKTSLKYTEVHLH